jgi:hypothetical protein
MFHLASTHSIDCPRFHISGILLGFTLLLSTASMPPNDFFLKVDCYHGKLLTAKLTTGRDERVCFAMCLSV